MKKNFVFVAFVALFALAITASAQKAADFSGTWNLKVPADNTRIKSQTLTITQSGTSFKTATKTEMNEAAGGGAPAGGGAGGGARPGGGFGGGGEQSYTLDGKEVSSERQGPNGAITIKTKAEQSGNKITISTTSPGPNGDITTKRTYELSSDGKGLTVTTESPRGTNKSEYTKG